MSTAANEPNEHTSAPMENTSAALVMAKCIESTLECLGVNERQSVQADMGRADVTQGQAPITIHVQAMDHQSFIDHASNIADALNHAIQSNLHPVVQSLRRQI